MRPSENSHGSQVSQSEVSQREALQREVVSLSEGGLKIIIRKRFTYFLFKYFYNFFFSTSQMNAGTSQMKSGTSQMKAGTSEMKARAPQK